MPHTRGLFRCTPTAHIHLLENDFDEKLEAKKGRSKATVQAKRRAAERRKQERKVFAQQREAKRGGKRAKTGAKA